MARTRKSMSCPECGGTAVLETRMDSVEYKGRTADVNVEGYWCQSCPEAILEGEALKARERAFLRLRAEVEGVLSPDEVAAIRGSLKLSQRKAGEILGGGPRAFQKYESGAQQVSAPMANLLRLLARDPKRLRELT